MIYDTTGTEFGWLVSQVAPWLNHVATKDDVIRCEPGQGLMFRVSCPVVQAYYPPKGHIPDMLGPGLTGKVWIKICNGVPTLDSPLQPLPLGDTSTKRTDLVLHCRAISKCPERNLGAEKWNLVVKRLRECGFDGVISVVGSNDDFFPVGADFNLKGVSAQYLIHQMRSAKLVVGASSGPMHLAQMCEAPIVVWSGNSYKDKNRYKSVWNHFKSPTSFISSSWDPGVDKIVQAILHAF